MSAQDVIDTKPTVDEVVRELYKIMELDCPIGHALVMVSAVSLLQSLAKDAQRYRYFRSRWKRIAWQHGSVEDYDVVNDDETLATDCNWGDERIGRALDTVIDAPLGEGVAGSAGGSMSRGNSNVYPETEYYDGRPTYVIGGLTIREDFAARAMLGMLSNPTHNGKPEDYAADAVKQADALIAELAKPVQP